MSSWAVLQPQELKGSLEEKEEPEMDFRWVIAPVSGINSVLLSRTSLRISAVHKRSFFSFSPVKE